jgi:type I restriction enzyme, R subunit
MPQFAFLSPEFADVHELATRAESVARGDLRAACVHARLALETMVNWLYAAEPSLKNPYERTLAARIHEATFQKLVGAALVAKARIVKDIGNRAAHEAKSVPVADAIAALRELFHFSYWFAHTYAKGAKPDPAIGFSPQALPQTSAASTQTLGQCPLGRGRQAARAGRGEANQARSARRPAAGQALRRLSRGAIRPTARHLLHQRLRALAVGRLPLSAPPRAGLPDPR